jgi:hypothetical protein
VQSIGLPMADESYLVIDTAQWTWRVADNA